ncbi:hypothetical protein DS2_00030 [Catenovulum agarivorans DS-2]|uniref:Lipoprotein n=1 Tax=Catenovulum agarivorans DS-2 TaxID=1328313 RepID=W7QGL8_9ALTE|nr:hypothetical protein [Catenovulum agarivorans]EWH12064.1 hypothetical protein DS2_00030 [Catenovulum agarivorans DS-2]
MKLVNTLALSLLVSLPASAIDLVNVKELPAWVQKAITEEKQVTSRSQLELKKFNVNSQVIGQLKLADQEENNWFYYTIDIGTDTPIECYVFSEYDGPANSLHSIMDSSFAGIEQLNNKKLSGKFNYAVDVGMVDNTPYISFDSLYLSGEGEQKVLGILKGLSAETDDSLQICLHNQIGYRQTFYKVFESFVQSFTQNKAEPHFFETVFKMSLNGIPMGFGSERYSLDQDGDVYIEAKSSLIVPVDANNVSRSDSSSQAWSQTDGSLINQVEYSVENSQLASNLSIQYQEEKWQVAGELQGKAVNVALAYNGQLLSDYGTYLESHNLMNSEGKTSSYKMWVNEADPTTALEVSLNKISDDKKANLKVDMGPISMDLLVNKDGTIKRGVMAQGAFKLDLTPIYHKGEPTLK